MNIAGMKPMAEQQDITLQGKTYMIYAYRYDGYGKFTYLYLDDSGTPSVIIVDKMMDTVSFYKLVAGAAAAAAQ